MPTVLRIGSYRFFFFSHEDREPPHIHVEQAGRYAKFWLRPAALAAAKGFRQAELTELRRLVVENRHQLEEAWHEHFRWKS